MQAVQIILIFLLISNVRNVFYVGRVKPGAFEYPKLNGWMLVSKAVDKCETDPSCGGFTFKGSYTTNNIPMEMYFFHIAKLQEDSHLKNIISIQYFVSKLYYLVKKFNYLKEMTKVVPKKVEQYFYWSTYNVNRRYVFISNLRVKHDASSSSKEIKDK